MWSVIDPEPGDAPCHRGAPEDRRDGDAAVLRGRGRLREHLRSNHQGRGATVGRDAYLRWCVSPRHLYSCALGWFKWIFFINTGVIKTSQRNINESPKLTEVKRFLNNHTDICKDPFQRPFMCELQRRSKVLWVLWERSLWGFNWGLIAFRNQFIVSALREKGFQSSFAGARRRRGGGAIAKVWERWRWIQAINSER